MAKTTFTDSYFKGQTAMIGRRRTQNGKPHSDRSSSRKWSATGPDAPLQIFFKGTVASGVMWMELGDASKIARIKVEGEKK